MKLKFLGLLLVTILLTGVLGGCGQKAQSPGSDAAANSVAAQKEEGTSEPENEQPAAETEATVPADGNPEDVTCKGSYTSRNNPDGVVASVSEAQLTNKALWVYYWAEVAAWQQSAQEVSPDFDRPLDTQACPVDDTVATWQQFFLKRALNTWHSCQALVLQGELEGVPTEEAYQPNKKNHETYLTDIPATKLLYGFNESYSPNSMHQEYLDAIPAMLETLAKEKGYTGVAAMAQEAASSSAEELTAYTEMVNRSYMYYTTLGYDIEPAAEDVEQYFTQRKKDYKEQGITGDSGVYVDIRHMLLVPENMASEESWEETHQEAVRLLDEWAAQKKCDEATFAAMANKNSDDSGSALNGGAYRQLKKGQLIPDLDSWCFDTNRRAGDTTLIRTEFGYHVLYFSGSKEIWFAEAEKDLIAQTQKALITTARETYPMEVDYSAISLSDASSEDSGISMADVLYPDIAHERFPEVPLYLQQDYPTTMYGSFKITSHGCGITTMAMLASYMADDDLTPPTLAARYGKYCHRNGTDGSLFVNTPPEMGFYLKEKVFDWRYAKEALEEGYLVVVVQFKGFWTRGGHYLVLEEMDENELVQVRDSNIYNYGRLHDHKKDRFKWSTIIPAGMGYWIYENKVTAIPACSRCGTGEEVSALAESYYCEKCMPAMLRRGSWLTGSGE